MPSFNPIEYAVPFFVALIVFEMVWARRAAPDAYEARDTFTSIAMGIGNAFLTLFAAGFIGASFFWVYQYRLFDIGWTWWAWILCFVLDDMGYYWFHRFTHRVRWMWASHVNHHSSQHYNLSTALRQPWTEHFGLYFVFHLPLALIGFHPAMALICYGFNLVYQFWFHTEVIDKCPRWFEAVFNTPSHHRVHHATNPIYLDRNYAGVFIIWDRLFGTFQAELADEKARYGIVKQLGSFNLLWVSFHEWIGIARDLRSAPWGSKLGYLWRPPGWSHDGSRETSDAIRERWLTQHGETPAE